MSSLGFDELSTLLGAYGDRYVASAIDPYHPILLAEAKKRVRQSWRLLLTAQEWHRQMKRLQPEMRKLAGYHGADPPQVALDMINATEALEMYTEAFYFIAWRLYQVIKMLPRLRNFRSPGVVNVRNHLIQHPEKHGQKELWGFGISDEGGPVLLRATQHDDPGLDKGLWHNARELADNLREVLNAAMAVSPDSTSAGAA